MIPGVFPRAPPASELAYALMIALKRAALVMFLVAVIASGLVGSESAAHGAEATSQGCGFVGGVEGYDDFYAGVGPITWEFWEGDQVTMTAGLPTTAHPPGWVSLLIDDVLVDRADFPGTVTFTFPETGDYSIRWDVYTANVTWKVDCVPGQPWWNGTFRDDDDSVFESDIEWMAAEGITLGCNPPTNTMYCPASDVSRGQMAAFLRRALSLPSTNADYFIDDNDSVFEADINALAAAGITKGCNPPRSDRFCPDGKVTREQMAAFLVRALGYTDDGGGDLFIDDDDSIFEGDIDRLGTAGVTKGCNPPTNDRFCPSGNVTRGQMAAFLHRALG